MNDSKSSRHFPFGFRLESLQARNVAYCNRTLRVLCQHSEENIVKARVSAKCPDDANKYYWFLLAVCPRVVCGCRNVEQSNCLRADPPTKDIASYSQAKALASTMGIPTDSTRMLAVVIQSDAYYFRVCRSASHNLPLLIPCLLCIHGVLFSDRVVFSSLRSILVFSRMRVEMERVSVDYFNSIGWNGSGRNPGLFSEI